MVKRSSLIIAAMTTASFAYLVSVSWLRWGHLIHDTSREVYVPFLLTQGKVLYKDIVFQYSFLPYYSVALLYQLFGPAPAVIMRLGLAITLLTSAAVYRLSRLFLERAFAALAMFTFLYAFAFGNYNYDGMMNFVFPYSIASTFYAVTLAWALYFFLRFILAGGARYLYAWGLTFSACLLSRLDLALPVYAAFLAAALILFARQGRRPSSGALRGFFLPLAVAVLGYVIFLARHAAFAAFKDSFFGYLRVAAREGRLVLLLKAGLENVPLYGLIMSEGLLAHLALIYLLGAAASLVIWSWRRHWRPVSVLAGLAAIGAVAAVAFYPNFILTQYRCLPLILCAGVPFFLLRALRQEDYRESVALFCLFLVALLGAARIFFKAMPLDYGFYLLTPGIIAYYLFFAKACRNFVQRRLACPPRLYAAMLCAMFGMFVVPYLAYSLTQYRMRSLQISSDRGTARYRPDAFTLGYWQIISQIRTKTPPEATLAVFPEGASINFYSKRDSPLRYHAFLPTDIMIFGEDSIIADLARARLDYIAVIHRETPEYGVPWFGVHYGKQVAAWIYAHYDSFLQYGAPPFSSPEFGIVVLKRNDAAFTRQ